jgi:outer membrane lipoprotein-sorting protein
MKKSILLLSGLLVVTMLNAQSLEEIVKKYTVANKLDKISGFSTIKITANMSMMGMNLPMELWMKNPNKIKTVTNMNGQEMISVFDGEKGYTINPMTGSTEPIEMSADQANQTMNNNMFQNSLANYLKNGKLSLAGEDKVNDKPAFILKADLGGGNSINMFIDKSSYLMVKTSISASGVMVDTYQSDFKEINGLFLPMKTTMSMSGMEIITTFDKVEVNIPMDDSIFKVK